MRTDVFSRSLFHFLLIAVLGLIIYSNTFNASFHYDDIHFIVDNPIIKDIGYYFDPEKADSLKELSNDDIQRFLKTRPVAYLSLWVNYRLGGLDVTGYHVVNIAVHIINALLAYLIVVLTFRTPLLKGSIMGERSGFIALFSGLLFIAHPLQTEAVTYMLQRCVVLVSMFSLLSIVFYIRFRLRTYEESSGSLWLYFAALLSCVLAMKTKESAFTLPVVIVLYDIMFFKTTFKKRAIFLVPFLLTMLIIPIEYINLRPDAELATTLDIASRSKYAPSRIDYLFTQFRVIVRYIGMILFPVGQSVDHEQQVYNSFLVPHVFLSFLFLLGVFGYSIYIYYRSRFTDYSLRLISFGICWFFLALFVESSIFPIGEMMVEYRVYPSSVGAYMVMAFGAFLLTSRLRNKAPAYAFMVLILMALSSATYARNYVWEDDLSLWQDAVEKSTNKARPHNNLGTVYLADGKIEAALEQFKLTLKLEPEHTEAHINLGGIYKAKGMMGEAIEHYRAALKSDPYSAETYIILGSAYLERGDADKAVEHFETALRLNPKNLAIAHNNLGAAYQSKDLFEKAVEHYRLAADLEPLDPTGYFNLGLIYQSRGLLDNAIQLYQIALKVAPNYAAAHGNLGFVYQSKGMIDKAIEHYRIALDQDTAYAEAHFNLGLVYFQKGDTEKAREEFEAALKINPDYDKARESLEKINKKQ
jgi:tetratricopeptide (TPR) repeat protein